MKYRKKPVEVEAMHVEQGYKNLGEIYDFVGNENVCSIERRLDYTLKIKTPNGNMNILGGDWIIKGGDSINGIHCWPVSNAYFAENYEKVEE